jgi:hypothetical protein
MDHTEPHARTTHGMLAQSGDGSMRAMRWGRNAAACLPVLALAAGLTGCKALNERYIALEVWKYEKCFGHLPPGFVPPGAAAPPAAQAAPVGPPPRVCGQNAACGQAACPPANSCDPCQGGGYGVPMDAGMPAGVGIPLGPGGSPGPTPAGVTAGRPIVISDEVVSP